LDGDRHALRPNLFQKTEGNLNQVFAGQNVGVKQVSDRIWLVIFMHYDRDYFEDETCRLEPVGNPFGPKVLPMSPEYIKIIWRPHPV
jgi:putative transposase